MKIVNLSAFSPEAKRLLLVNTVFAFALPLQAIFANAFIWRQTNDFVFVFSFNCAAFIGVALGYILNGFLLQRLPIKKVFFGCMLLSMATLFTLFFLTVISLKALLIVGLINGTAMGLYWSNRMYLIMMNTTDVNRNYYNGIEMTVFVLADVVTAFFSGMFIGHAGKFGLSAVAAYQLIVAGAFVLVLTSGMVLLRGNYRNPAIKRFLYRNFVRQWNWMRLYAVILGLTEGCTLTLPTLLILNFLGNESALGIVEAVSTILSITMVYLVGTWAKPIHRTAVVTAGVLLVITGTVAFGVLYSSLGVILFQVSNILSKPLNETVSRSTLMRAVEDAARQEHRNEYSYMIDNEIMREGGRLAGALIFLCIYYRTSLEVALRWTMILLAGLSVNAIWLVKILNPDTLSKEEATMKPTIST